MSVAAQMGVYLVHCLNKSMKERFNTISKSSTDAMLKKFPNVYNGEIVICDLKDDDRILENVVNATSIAVTRDISTLA